MIRARLADNMARSASQPLITCIAGNLLVCLGLAASFTSPAMAGLHIGESPMGILDARDPVVVILYPTEPETFTAETVVYFRWGEADDHPGQDPGDHTAYVTIAGQLYESTEYTPDPDQNEWAWLVPNQTTASGQFHVMVTDQLGNTTIAASPLFSILPVITGLEPGTPSLPDRLDLAPPHPNPFNPATRIAFDLPTAGQVALAVHDLQGRRVWELQRGERPAGRYTLVWQGQDSSGRRVAGGIYLVRLAFESGGESQILTRKVVLLP